LNEPINVNVDHDKVDAKYTDQVIITHNPFGFTLDFAQQIPQMRIVKVVARIAMSPEHAKAFNEALADNIKNYEKSFGEIRLTNQMKAELVQKKKIGFRISD